MTDLQLALLAIGILVILLFAGQLWWMGRRKKNFSYATEAQDAPVMNEPILDASLDSVPKSNVHKVLPSIDPLIDGVAMIKSDRTDSLVSGDAVLTALPASWRIGSKLFCIEGMSVNTQRWEFPVAGAHYNAFQAAIQLANRSGALNEIEFSEFVAKVQTIADAIDMGVEFPEMLQEIAKAKELDQFASTHDAQLSFTLRAIKSLWSQGYISKVANDRGFLPVSVHGKLILPAPIEGVPALLTLSFDVRDGTQDDPNQSAIAQVLLQLDVTHVPRSMHPYQILCETAKSLALSMDAIITDDTGAPVTQEAMNQIGRDLQQLYDELDLRDLSAGSSQARRLFS